MASGHSDIDMESTPSDPDVRKSRKAFVPLGLSSAFESYDVGRDIEQAILIQITDRE